VGNICAQDFSPFEKHWFMQNGDTLPYRILLPPDFEPSRKYPLVLFLHGRGESGTDNEKQLTHGARLFLQDSNRKKYPAIVVFPQCRPNSYWSNVHTVTTGSKYSKRSFYFVSDGAPSVAMMQVLALLDNLFVRYLVDRRQVYVMGLSMGGMGTYEIVRRKPKLFAAAIAICGGAHTETAPQIRKTKWWLLHGAKDDIVRPEYSEQMAEALRQAKAKVKLTIYPNANHNSWDAAFAEPALLDWLFSQRR
jgi:predicted peptidase